MHQCLGRSCMGGDTCSESHHFSGNALNSCHSKYLWVSSHIHAPMGNGYFLFLVRRYAIRLVLFSDIHSREVQLGPLWRIPTKAVDASGHWWCFRSAGWGSAVGRASRRQQLSKGPQRAPGEAELYTASSRTSVFRIIFRLVENQPVTAASS